MNIFYIFCLGTICGSFTHASAIRYQNKAYPKMSCCDYCHTLLSWKEKIPIISFIYLKGRCFHCGHKISCSTLLFEALCGILFVILNYLYSTVYFAYIASIGLILLYSAKIDWDCYLIPDRCHFLLLILFFLHYILYPTPVLDHFLAALLYSLPLSLFAIKEWIGWGDIKLLFSLGLCAGSTPITSICLIASVLSICHFPFTRRAQLPFAPYLFLGFITFCLFGA